MMELRAENIRKQEIIDNLHEKGTFGMCYEFICINDSKSYAAKTIKKNLIMDKNEINIHKRLKHPNVEQFFNYFEDDLALVSIANNKGDLIWNTDRSLKRIDHEHRELGLQIAPEKTEAIILAGPRKREGTTFLLLGGHKITPVRSVKYLGIRFNGKGTFKDHIWRTAERAKSRVRDLSKILHNVTLGRAARNMKTASQNVTTSRDCIFNSCRVLLANVMR